LPVSTLMTEIKTVLNREHHYTAICGKGNKKPNKELIEIITSELQICINPKICTATLVTQG